MYFEKFPITYYTLDNYRTVQSVRNIFIRVKIDELIKQNYALYDEYDILDGETPELVSFKFYDSTSYAWVVLHMNDILDPRFGWPLSSSNLVAYAQDKYDDITAPHHYVNADGYIVNSDAVGATAVSNFDYEVSVNESKRRINILKPEYLESVVKEFDSKLENING